MSGEYPVYQVRSDVALGEYIKLVFRTSHFRQVINGMISGASGRKRVQPEQIECVDIPLPSLETQQAIVARWQVAQAEADGARSSLRQVVDDLNTRLYGLSLLSANCPCVAGKRHGPEDASGCKTLT